MVFLWFIIIAHIVWEWSMAVRSGLAARRRISPKFSLVAKPLVSVLIPAWKEREGLKATLDALALSIYSNWEAIIIAGGEDGTEEFARALCASQKKISVITQPPLGKNAALNLGFAQSRGEIIVMLDADTEVENNWLGNLVAPILGNVDAATGNYFPKVRSWVSALLEIEKVSAYFVHDSVTLNGCAGIAVSRELLDRIGGFPESVTVGVDFDLDQRIKGLNARLVFAPAARAKTDQAYTLRDHWQNEVRWRRAHLQIIFRYRKWFAFSFYLMAILFYLTPLIVFNDMRELWPILWMWLLLRRLSLSIETSIYDHSWIKYALVPIVLLPVDFLAGIVALITIRRRPIIFKGFRPQKG
jgi:cellulose synthase/poly-beta-1,6-N-acetylglucosamine synthase-like glycosyltransferase